MVRAEVHEGVLGQGDDRLPAVTQAQECRVDLRADVGLEDVAGPVRLCWAVEKGLAPAELVEAAKADELALARDGLCVFEDDDPLCI